VKILEVVVGFVRVEREQTEQRPEDLGIYRVD